MYVDMQLEKAMAPHSSTLAWKIPWMEGAWWAAVHGVARSRTRLSDFTFTFHVHALEKDMATHSSVLAWRIPGTGSLVGCCLWGRTDPACHMEQPKNKHQKHNKKTDPWPHGVYIQLKIQLNFLYSAEYRKYTQNTQ